MGHKILKKKTKTLVLKKRSLVEQNDGWYFTLGLGRCEGVGEWDMGMRDIHALTFMWAPYLNVFSVQSLHVHLGGE